MGWELIDATGCAHEVRDGCIIGRSPRVDIVVNDPLVSRQHAQFRVIGSEIEIRDLSSTNHTWVNGVEVTGSQRLFSGNAVRVGQSTLWLRWTPEDEAAQAERRRRQLPLRPPVIVPVPAPVRHEVRTREEARHRREDEHGEEPQDSARPREPEREPGGWVHRERHEERRSREQDARQPEQGSDRSDEAMRQSMAQEHDLMGAAPHWIEAGGCPRCGSARGVMYASQAGLAGPVAPARTLVTIFSVWFWSAVIFALVVAALFVFGAAVTGGLYEYILPGLGGLGAGIVLFGLLIYIPFLLIAVGIPWGFRRAVSRRYQRQLAAWEAANNVFQQLQFCGDCVGVFLPATRRLTPVEHLPTFLQAWARDNVA